MTTKKKSNNNPLSGYILSPNEVESKKRYFLTDKAIYVSTVYAPGNIERSTGLLVQGYTFYVTTISLSGKLTNDMNLTILDDQLIPRHSVYVQGGTYFSRDFTFPTPLPFICKRLDSNKRGVFMFLNNDVTIQLPDVINVVLCGYYELSV
jgi:hypothetical protein